MFRKQKRSKKQVSVLSASAHPAPCCCRHGQRLPAVVLLKEAQCCKAGAHLPAPAAGLGEDGVCSPPKPREERASESNGTWCTPQPPPQSRRMYFRSWGCKKKPPKDLNLPYWKLQPQRPSQASNCCVLKGKTHLILCFQCLEASLFPTLFWVPMMAAVSQWIPAFSKSNLRTYSQRSSSLRHEIHL